MIKTIFKLYLYLSGWKLIRKPLPTVQKAVCIFAPHTSNWDFMTMISVKFALGIQVRFLGKHSLFQWPYGWLFKALGGLPVVRHKHNNVVGQVAKLIADEDHIWLALAPEGTRSFTPFWKTGFYHIAEQANLPIIMFYLDNKTRTVGFAELFYLTNDINADMDVFKAFYADKIGYKPEQTSIVQTKKQYQLQKNKAAT